MLAGIVTPNQMRRRCPVNRCRSHICIDPLHHAVMIALGAVLVPALQIVQASLVAGFATDDLADLRARHRGKQILAAGTVDAVEGELFVAHAAPQEMQAILAHYRWKKGISVALFALSAQCALPA